LAQNERVRLMGERRDNCDYVATLSFTVDGLAATQMAEMLDADFHICARAGLHCAPAVHKRLSPGYFTEDQDVDHLLDSIDQILK